MTLALDERLIRKVLKIVDAGLVKGVGRREPGQMCVEAAICYALGEPHGDQPSCVAGAVRSSKIALNDGPWSSDAARAKGLRAIAVAQLGSKDTVDEKRYAEILAELTIRRIVPVALRAAAKAIPDHGEVLEAAAKRCEAEGTEDAANAAYAANAACAANAAANAACAAYAANAAATAANAAANAANAAYAANAAANAANAAANAANAAYAAKAAANAANAAANAAYAAANAANAAYAANAAAYAANAAANAACAVNAACAANAAATAANAAANAAYAVNAACAANAAANAANEILTLSADCMVKALLECGSPGCQFLYLVEETA